MNHSRWNLLPPAPENLLNASALPPLIVQLLYNRGLAEASQFEPFIDAGEHLEGDPFLLPDMDQAVVRICRALLSGENIAIYGDYDVDGIAATALLNKGLSLLDGNVIPYIPHRLTEGYGLTTAALEGLHRQGVTLVITVDCGITAIPEVRKANRLGMDVIITDHHTTLPKLPPAHAIVSPRVTGSAYPFSELTGAGVAFKLLQALFRSLGREEQIQDMADMAALGTIADVAPLVGENRYLAKQGLKLINHTPRLGIREIITRTGLVPGSIDSETVSWVLAPRLNAAGRMAHAISSYQLLMTESPEEASQLASWLERKNAERQRLTSRVLAQAREQALDRGISPLLIAAGRDYPLGIAGLAAGRLSEEFYRPAIVIRTGEQTSSGSCRSIPEFNIALALQQCRRLLSHFGGHSQAAGFTLPTRNLPRLTEMLSQFAAAQLEGIDLKPRIDIDAEAFLPELTGDTFQSIQRLAPFGRGNPSPIFISRGVEVSDCRTMGGNGEHLRLKLRQQGTTWHGVAFRSGSYLSEIVPIMDIVFNLEIDRWQGKETLRLNILDFAPGQG